MNRTPEWVAAEAALEDSCEAALHQGLRLVHDSYGLSFGYEDDSRVYKSSPFTKSVCAVGSYLLSKNWNELIWTSDAAHYLGVSLDWVSHVEHGFAHDELSDEEWYRLTEDQRDGYETGLRLNRRFTPTSHRKV